MRFFLIGYAKDRGLTQVGNEEQVDEMIRFIAPDGYEDKPMDEWPSNVDFEVVKRVSNVVEVYRDALAALIPLSNAAKGLYLFVLAYSYNEQPVPVIAEQFTESLGCDVDELRQAFRELQAAGLVASKGQTMRAIRSLSFEPLASNRLWANARNVYLENDEGLMQLILEGENTDDD